MELAKRHPRTDAEVAFESAIDLAPDMLVARAALANLLQIDGRVPEAIAQYKEMRKRQPNNPAILNDLAWLMASSDDPQIRNPTEAINLASKACELTNHRMASVLDTLATAFASADRFDDAVETMQKALALSTAKNAKPSVSELREKLRRYESAGRAIRE